MSPAGVLFATFAVLMLLGSPITVALGVAAMAALYTVDQNLVTLVQIAFTSVNSFPIMALPAFMLVGALMECAGISRRLVAIAENIVGPIPAGSPSPPHWPACFSGRFPVPAPRRPPPWGCL